MEKKYNQTPPCSGKFDVAISGGGMVGLSLGVALAQSGLRVALIEQGALSAQREAGFDGRVSAVALGSQYMLQHIGAWQHIAPHAQPITDIRVSDGDTPFFLHYHHREVSEEPFGTIVENRHIRAGLHEAARACPNLEIFESSRLNSYTLQGERVQLHLSNELCLEARLLVGAEGRKSTVRGLSGIGEIGWSYKQTAIVCTIGHSLPHAGLAQERFLPAGPFAVLPMTGDRSSLVWVEPEARVGMYMELEDSEFLQEIRERVGDYLGELSLIGPRYTYPLSLMHAKRYTAARVALAGDAAHGMHPLAGQGVNLGFRDVAVLHELIVSRHRLGLDFGDGATLARYERWRSFDNVAMLAATESLNRLFSNAIPPVRLARGLGLWAVGQLPGVKRFFMKHAMGLMGDVPPLLKPLIKA